MNKLFISLLLFCIFYSSQSKAYQSCYQKCVEDSQCAQDYHCSSELQHCDHCRSIYDEELQTGQNPPQVQCFDDCFENDLKTKISENTFAFTLCHKKCLQDLKPRVKLAYVISKHYLVKNAFENHKNWEVLQENLLEYPNWDFKWMFYHRYLNYNPSYPHPQIGNKIQNMQDIIGDKLQSMKLLQEFDKLNRYKLKSQLFLPETYVVDLKDALSFLDNPLFKKNNFKRQYWIMKNPSGYGGEGLLIFKDLKEAQRQIGQYQKSYDNYILQWLGLTPPQQIQQHILVQKYFENPLLIDGKKFDMRTYVLVANTEPYFALFHHGYLRRCLEKFDLELNGWDLFQKIKHLTNSHMQEQHPNFRDLKSQHGMVYKNFLEYLRKNENASQQNLTDISNQIKAISAYMFTAAQEKLTKTPHAFHLTGNDFMMDSNKKVYLLEGNQNPRIQEQFPGEMQLSPLIANSTIDIILQLQDNSQKDIKRILQNPEKFLNLWDWEIIINEETGYNFLDEYVPQ